MEALRTLLKPEKGVLTIKLPQYLAKKDELEVIVLAVTEKESRPTKSFNPADYFGMWRHKHIDADKVSKEMRDEWEREF